MLTPLAKALWQRLKQEPLLKGAIMVGGSALTLHLHHRLSEDLDWAYPTARLPRAVIDEVVGLLIQEGYRLQRKDDPVADDDFSLAGESLHDHQQDFVVNETMKLSFFTLSREARSVMEPGDHSLPRLASVDEIFALKSLVILQRSKSRDWLDLYLLMRDRGYSFADFEQVYQKAGCVGSFDLAANKLCHLQPNPSDEGYEALMIDSPTLTGMETFFIRKRDEYEQSRAAESFRPPVKE